MLRLILPLKKKEKKEKLRGGKTFRPDGSAGAGQSDGRLGRM